MTLKTCGKEDCCPLEQIRGQMGVGDYYDVIVHNSGGRWGGVPEPEKYGYPLRAGEDVPEGIKPEHCVETNEAGSNDFRICCKTCGKATPWGANDIPGMPGAGADWTRKKWNDAAEKT